MITNDDIVKEKYAPKYCGVCNQIDYETGFCKKYNIRLIYRSNYRSHIFIPYEKCYKCVNEKQEIEGT